MLENKSNATEICLLIASNKHALKTVLSKRIIIKVMNVRYIWNFKLSSSITNKVKRNNGIKRKELLITKQFRRILRECC